MKKFFAVYVLLACLTFGIVKVVDACTNILVTKGASVDGSTMVSYAADSGVLYGELYFRPAADYAEGEMLKVYDWDSGKYLGEIPQVAHTYQTMGNMNEHQLAIGETTFTGLEELSEPEGIIDYGSLIYITLQRAKTAREAIKVMDELVQTYGYASSGESFSISDPNEVWIMELIGKGKHEKGAVWVARLVPDGYISSHANQSRIDTFPLDEPETTMYSPDVISFARKYGYYKGKDKNFSFAETYNPFDFGGMRYCEARVWAVFNMFSEGMEKHLDYAMGHNQFNRMPLWVKPTEKLSVADVARAMRDHYEGTAMDMTKDIGAGAEACPYRIKPLSFEYEGQTYVHERALAVQQTGFWFVTQSRSWLPDAIGAVNWFAVDDAATSCMFPMYASATAVPDSYREGGGTMLEYSDDSAFWIFNRVAQFAYLRYNVVGKYVAEEANKFETACFTAQPAIEKAALELYETSPEAAVEFLTNYSVSKGDELFNKWCKLDKYVMARFMDMYNKKVDENGKLINNGIADDRVAFPVSVGYPEHIKKAIVETHGDVIIQKEVKTKK